MVVTAQPQTGTFISTTFLTDMSLLSQIDVNKPEFKELLRRLYLDLNKMAVAINNKVSGVNDIIEYVSGKNFFSMPTAANNYDVTLRPAYTTVVNFGALPNNATIAVAHGLTFTNAVVFTNIYGAATNQSVPEGLPLPYASATAVADTIEVWVDGTNVYIATGANYSAYTGIVILEYLKY